MKNRTYLRCVALLVPGLLALGALVRGAGPAPAWRPKYTKEKELVLPSGYHTWVFVGANLSLKYDEDRAESAPQERRRHDDSEYRAF